MGMRAIVRSTCCVALLAGCGTGGDQGPDTVDPIHPTLEPGACGLDQPAFCEKFDQPQPGGRGGDLDEQNWSYSRYGHPETQSFFLRGPFSTQNDLLFPATFCGAPFENVMPGDDARFCYGSGVDGERSAQFHEVLDDEGDFGFNSMRIRQPFDFTDRVGRIVWDVDAKVNPVNQGHGWWIELWLTEDPQPMPYHTAPTVAGYPRNGVGFTFQFGGDCPETTTHWENSLEGVTVVRDQHILHSIPFWEMENHDDVRCFDVADGKLNHLEMRITKDRAELWASDAEAPDTFKLRSAVSGLDLPFTRGYVHFQHAAYNASKDYVEIPGNEDGRHPTRVQSFRWDNIGFDGPTYPRPRAYDVADNTEIAAYGRVLTAYTLPNGASHMFTLPGVSLADAVTASFNFDVFAAEGQVLEYRFNGGTWRSRQLGSDPSVNGDGMRGFTAPVELADLVEGDNTVEVRFGANNYLENDRIGNIDLTIDAQQ
jgi:hypothetical protein